MSLFMVSEHDARNEFDTENSIKSLAKIVDRVASERSFLRQAHFADLTWVLGELKGVLANWGEDEISNAVTKKRVQHLVEALDNKIIEDV